MKIIERAGKDLLAAVELKKESFGNFRYKKIKKALKGIIDGTISLKITYSGRFKGYNASIYYKRNMESFELRLSKSWRGISQDIKTGIIEHLLAKALNIKISTTYTELYDIFIKKLASISKPTKVEPELKERFIKINMEYFGGCLELPSLVWCNSIQKLGSYNYASNTISISRHLKEKPELLDYVLYHEMLHKKLKYKTKNGKSYHHTKEFRDAEKRFKNSKMLEKELKSFVRKKSLKKRIWPF